MTDQHIQRALISVYDKTGIVPFARRLAAAGVELISTGGTAALLAQAGIEVRAVEQVTGSPELFDGRVKTLHPRIHGAILADRSNPAHRDQLLEHDIAPIDLVVVNLYPFADTVAQADCSRAQGIEMIDIGGPCMLRAAAKNHDHVLVITDPADYDRVAELLESNSAAQHWADLRRQNAAAAFAHTADYDSAVAAWLNPDDCRQVFQFKRRGTLRYGENPHQTAVLLTSNSTGPDLTVPPCGVSGAPPMSYNNYADAHAALALCGDLTRELRGAACCFVKHGNPCGCGVADDPIDAYRKAYLGDPLAAMGGVLAINVPVTPVVAAAVTESLPRWGRAAGAEAFFVEVWVAPQFEPEALELISSYGSWGRRVRCLAGESLTDPPLADTLELRSISGGALLQTLDVLGLDEAHWQNVGRRPPDPAELDDLRLAWLICKHTRSNAVTLCHHGMLLGNGAGQMSRVMSCRLACWLARDNGHAADLQGAVAASDAFFPFRDGPDLLLEAGIRALIQPGGSKRDADTIAACDAKDVAMVMTGVRHFRH